MADSDLTLKIDAALAARLRADAEAMGQSVEAYALGLLRRAVEQPGLQDNETPWKGAPAQDPHDNGFGEDAEAYADEIDRICDEAEQTGGVPFEVFRERLRNLGQPR